MEGRCHCGNITLNWQPELPLAAPRACQCDYCRQRQAAYVSDSRTGFLVYIQHRDRHKIVTHGTQTAEFHECSACDRLVFVSSLIEDEHYGVINIRCLKAEDIGEKSCDPAVVVSFADEELAARLARRKNNWCTPIRLIYAG